MVILLDGGMQVILALTPMDWLNHIMFFNQLDHKLHHLTQWTTKTSRSFSSNYEVLNEDIQV